MYPNFPPNQPPYGNQNQMPYGAPNQQIPPYPGMNPYPNAIPAYPNAGMAYPDPNMTYPPTMSGFPPQNQPFPQQTYAPQYGNYQQAPPEQFYQQQSAGMSYQQPGQVSAYRQPRPTVLPAQPFDAANDAAILRKAMKGFGTDEDALINVLCRRPSFQRMEIVKAFKTSYGKDLIENIKKETTNNFQKLLVALCTPLTVYYCEELNEAMAGTGTDEEALIEVLVGLPNSQIHAINAQYSYMYKMTLEDALRGETSNCFRRILTSLLTGNRDESTVTDINSARNDAQVLKNSGVGRWGTDESEFNRILCLRNKEQLKLVAQEYEKLSGNTLEKDIKREFSGDIEDAMVSILRCCINSSRYYAKRIHNTMAGFGTNDRALIRLLVTRSEIDMQDIKEEYQRKYNKTLKSMIKGDTSGDYKHGLYALIGEDRS